MAQQSFDVCKDSTWVLNSMSRIYSLGRARPLTSATRGSRMVSLSVASTKPSAIVSVTIARRTYKQIYQYCISSSLFCPYQKALLSPWSTSSEATMRTSLFIENLRIFAIRQVKQIRIPLLKRLGAQDVDQKSSPVYEINSPQARVTVKGSTPVFLSTMPSVNLSFFKVPYDLSHLTPRCPLLAQESQAQLPPIRSRKMQTLTGDRRSWTEISPIIDSKVHRVDEVDLLLQIRIPA